MCCSTGWIDGDFGAGTEVTVRKFQGKYGLVVDGFVGTGTWRKLIRGLMGSDPIKKV